MDTNATADSAHGKTPVHFPNLNSIRVIAAFAVVVHHIELAKTWLGLPNVFHVAAVEAMGPLGVVLFFVLSGFLITYLLLLEERRESRISVRRFYIRRILRIWPLYYLVVTLSLFVLPRIDALQPFAGVPDPHFAVKAMMMLGFLPNVALVLYTAVPFISQAWSIGSEEQFYLVWPWIIRRSRGRYVALLVTIGAYGALLAVFFVLRNSSSSTLVRALAGLLGTLSIDCMAIGGIAAVVHLRRERILAVLFDRRLQAVVYVVLLAMLGTGFMLPNRLHYHVYAPLFALVILNLACNPRSLISLETPLLDYLGRISYGIYMYHGIAIAITFKLLTVLRMERVVVFQYAGTVLLTVAIAAISYYAFEHPILRKKIAFSSVVSGDIAAETESSSAAPT
jgi:peptidoglycan/LPS O-acetylase OafA/YrhL